MGLFGAIFKPFEAVFDVTKSIASTAIDVTTDAMDTVTFGATGKIEDAAEFMTHKGGQALGIGLHPSEALSPADNVAKVYKNQYQQTVAAGKAAKYRRDQYNAIRSKYLRGSVSNNTSSNSVLGGQGGGLIIG